MRTFYSSPIRTTLGCVVACLLIGSQAGAVLLQDQNSTANIDPYGATGMNSWVVDEIDHLNTQWFWYRDASMTRELSLDNLDTTPLVTSTANTMSSLYTGAGYSINVTYTLTGSAAGSGSSLINEDITISNTSGGDLALSFYQYSDFDLAGTAADDEVRLIVPPGGGFVRAQQWEDMASGLQELITDREMTTTTPADRGEAAFALSTLLKLQDGNIDPLNNNAGPVGEGDVTFAFQWDYDAIPDGTSVTISKVKSLVVQPVPEPAAAGLLLLGLGLLAGRRRVK